MAELFAQVDYWGWWILAVVLLVLEAFAPGTFFLWMGIAAALVGLLLMIAPDIGWEYQLITFAVLSVASIALWRNYFRRHPITTDQPTLNRRGAQYVGRIFTLAEPITNNSGRIRVDDTLWKIRGSDCASGARVKVVGVDGVILLVEAVDE